MARKQNAAAAVALVPEVDEKAGRVAKERARLQKLFAGADKNKVDFIQETIKQLAWLGVTIVELQEQIDAAGVVLQFQNGANQSGFQLNPACKLLKDYQQNYNTNFRALLPLVPAKAKQGGKLAELQLNLNDV